MILDRADILPFGVLVPIAECLVAIRAVRGVVSLDPKTREIRSQWPDLGGILRPKPCEAWMRQEPNSESGPPDPGRVAAQRFPEGYLFFWRRKMAPSRRVVRGPP